MEGDEETEPEAVGSSCAECGFGFEEPGEKPPARKPSPESEGSRREPRAREPEHAPIILDALMRLLIRKGVIDADEIKNEIRDYMKR